MIYGHNTHVFVFISTLTVNTFASQTLPDFQTSLPVRQFEVSDKIQNNKQSLVEW